MKIEGDKMNNDRQKDLMLVFEERYRANHNKKLEEAARNRKKDMTDRMFGGMETTQTRNTPIGYNPSIRNNR